MSEPQPQQSTPVQELAAMRANFGVLDFSNVKLSPEQNEELKALLVQGKQAENEGKLQDALRCYREYLRNFKQIQVEQEGGEDLDLEFEFDITDRKLVGKPLEREGVVYMVVAEPTFDEGHVQRVINHHGENIGEEYLKVELCPEIKNKFYAKAITLEDGPGDDSIQVSINNEGQEVVARSDQIVDIFEIDGDIIFAAIVEGGDLKLLDERGGMLVNYSVGQQERVLDLTKANRELYSAIHFLNGEIVVTNEDTLIEVGRYKSIGKLTTINNNLYFAAEVARENPEADERDVYWAIFNEQGQTVGGSYDKVEDPIELNGELYYIAHKLFEDPDNPGEKITKKFLVDHRGNESAGWDEIEDPVWFPHHSTGEVCFIASNHGRKFIINFEGHQQSSRVYQDIKDLHISNGALLFCAGIQEGGVDIEYQVENLVGEKIGKKHHRIALFTTINNKPVYIIDTPLSKKVALRNHEDKLITEAFDEIYNVVQHADSQILVTGKQTSQDGKTTKLVRKKFDLNEPI